MMEDKRKIIKLPSVVPVKLLAEELGVSAVEIITKLMQSGVLATINESIDFDTAAIIADEFETDLEKSESNYSYLNMAKDYFYSVMGSTVIPTELNIYPTESKCFLDNCPDKTCPGPGTTNCKTS